jgi:trans-aconitate methyltransferase
MARDLDVAAFGERARGYEAGWLGRLHHEIAGRVRDLALARVPAPRRVLDVGCGTGYLLRRLAGRYPGADAMAGVDAAAAMVQVAAGAAADGPHRDGGEAGTRPAREPGAAMTALA